MTNVNIQTLKGFRDFLPADALKRQWLKNKLASICESWGFDPMETPTLEPLELFAGQIGEDEKLFFKFQDNGGRDVALRYDQTVPTCRIVGQNYQNLPMPFRRYQIQPAFRAENTQKGRYREFTQCDADIFGVAGPSADAQVIALSLDIYRQLGFKNAVVLVNDRSLLADIPYSAIVAIDKLDKIGEAGVIADMVKKGITEEDANKYFSYVKNLQPNDTINIIFDFLKSAGFPKDWYRFESTLARSFSYSTGPIWEIKIPEAGTSSVLGGERFDKLVEKVSGVSIPGTGFGLGFDRTLEACEQLGLIPNLSTLTQVLVTIFAPDLYSASQKLFADLKSSGINSELYPDPTVKLDKQLKYAAKKGIPFVAVLGPEEVSQNLMALKTMSTGEQKQLSLSDCLNLLQTS